MSARPRLFPCLQQAKAFPLLGNQNNSKEFTQSQSEIIDKVDQEAVLSSSHQDGRDIKIDNLEKEKTLLTCPSRRTQLCQGEPCQSKS